MVRRRTVLRRGLAAVGVAGVGTLAGCQEDLPGNEDDTDGGDEDGGDGDDGDAAGPEWAAPLYDPTAVGEVDAHGFAKYEVAELLSYRDRLPPELDEGLDDAFAELDGFETDDVDRVVAQVFGQVPDPEATGPAEEPAGWNVVATGSFDAGTLVGRLEETEAYEAAGEYEGVRLFEGPPDEERTAAAVGVSGDAVIGAGVVEYDLEATAAVERAVDADAGSVDRYYGADDHVAALMDRHGDGTTASGAADPEGSFQPFVEENPSSQGYEALLTTARAVGRSTTVGEETTETLVSVEVSEANQEAVENLRTAVDRAQAERGDPEGPFSDPSISADGTTLLVEASAETSRALGEPSGLVVVAPEAAVLGAFGLNVGGSDSEGDPAPQVALGFGQQSDGRVEIRHDGGDRVERLTVRYSLQDGGRTGETWTESDGVAAGDTYVTEGVPEPGSELLVVWESEAQSAVVAEYDVPA